MSLASVLSSPAARKDEATGRRDGCCVPNLHSPRARSSDSIDLSDGRMVNQPSGNAIISSSTHIFAVVMHKEKRRKGKCSSVLPCAPAPTPFHPFLRGKHPFPIPVLISRRSGIALPCSTFIRADGGPSVNARYTVLSRIFSFPFSAWILVP